MSRPAPVRSLREWLQRLAANGRLAVLHPGIGLNHEAAAVANRLDGMRATLFPRPGGHSGTIVAGLVSSRAWMAEALGTTEDAHIAHYTGPPLTRCPGASCRPAPPSRWSTGTASTF